MRKRICKYFLMLMALLPLTSCSQNKMNKIQESMKKGKTLVVYFSKAGENYAVGNIKKGNTRIIAEMIAEESDGTLFQIEPVYTFIEKHSWQGKTVIPFSTHEGSGLGSTESSLKKACEGATVLKGLAVRGTIAQNSQEQARKAVENWLAGLSE